jgi:hypothetical protein
MKTGRITSIDWESGSGIAIVYFDTGFCYAEAGPLFRSLADAFGDESATGQLVEYDVDDLGVMTYFAPTAEEQPSNGNGKAH